MSMELFQVIAVSFGLGAIFGIELQRRSERKSRKYK